MRMRMRTGWGGGAQELPRRQKVKLPAVMSGSERNNLTVNKGALP
jgi:hypothetical protein